MARRGENIYLRKDGRYEGRYRKGKKSDGSICWGYVYGKQYQDVKNKLMQQKVKRLEIKGETDQNYSWMPLREWLVYWLEVLTKPYIRESTYMSYKQYIYGHLIPALGNTRLYDADSRIVREAVAVISRKLSMKTVHNIFRLLKAVFQEAVNRGILRSNPCNGVRLSAASKSQVRILTRKEQQNLEKAAILDNRTEILLCLYTGLRVGELCALTWSDVDIAEQCIHVSRTVQRLPCTDEKRKTKLYLQQPKTENAIRCIPVPPFVMKLLEQQRGPGTSAEDFLYAIRDKTPPDPRTMQKRIESLGTKLGLRDVHMHTLRHTYATRCLEQEVGYETLCDLLGHSSPTVTLQYYAHTTLEHKRQCVERLEQLAIKRSS